MLKLQIDNWQFRTDNALRKQAMFDLAKSYGVPMPHPLRGFEQDGDPFISWFADGGYLGVLPARVGDYRVARNTLIDEEAFVAMCKDYQAEQVAKRELVTVN